MDTLSWDLLLQLIRHQLWVCFHERTHTKCHIFQYGKGAPSRYASDVFRTLCLINITALRSITLVWKLIRCSEYLRDFLTSTGLIFAFLLDFQHWILSESEANGVNAERTPLLFVSDVRFLHPKATCAFIDNCLSYLQIYPDNPEDTWISLSHLLSGPTCDVVLERNIRCLWWNTHQNETCVGLIYKLSIRTMNK